MEAISLVMILRGSLEESDHAKRIQDLGLIESGNSKASYSQSLIELVKNFPGPPFFICKNEGFGLNDL